jgi:HSP20 family protein
MRRSGAYLVLAGEPFPAAGVFRTRFNMRMETHMAFRPLSLFNRNPSLPSAPSEAYSSDPFFRLQHEMNRLFDDAFSGFQFPAAFRGDGDETRLPRIDVHEADHAVEVEAELPGVDEKDIDVQVTDNLLTIRGEKKFERKDAKEGQYRVMERSYGSFTRSMTLPFSVNPDAVEATFKNGVLKLTLPKPPEAQLQTKRIAIKRA